MNRNYILGLALLFAGALMSVNAADPDPTAHNVEIEGNQHIIFEGERPCDPIYKTTMYFDATWEEGTIALLKEDIYPCVRARAGFGFLINDLVLLSYSKEANVLRELADSELVSNVSKDLVVYCATDDEGDITDLPEKFRGVRIDRLAEDVCVGAACVRAK